MLLTLSQFAEYAQLDYETVRRHAARGSLKGASKVCGQWRVNMAEWSTQEEPMPCISEKVVRSGGSRSKEYLEALGLLTKPSRGGKKRGSGSKRGNKNDLASSPQEAGLTA
jgi:hypothetical protein